MTMIHPDLARVRACIHLDLIDSSGNSVRAMHQEHARPMALSRGTEEVWYGFILNDVDVDVIAPGTSATCIVSFLNHEGARQAFPSGTSILFGDGSVTKGVLTIESFD